jgi:hypothetical protein
MIPHRDPLLDRVSGGDGPCTAGGIKTGTKQAVIPDNPGNGVRKTDWFYWGGCAAFTTRNVPVLMQLLTGHQTSSRTR